jgi:ribosomal-protein-alanine N-acetyltransferase
LNTLCEKGSGALIGYCGLLVQTLDGLPELEIGYSLLPAHWDQGYATEAALTCKAFTNTHHLAQSIISIISLTNVASQRVVLNLGIHVEKITWDAANEVTIFRVALDAG